MSKPKIELPSFAPITITAADVVTVARFFKGVKYQETGGFVRIDTDVDGNEIARGTCNCWELLFLVAIRLELVPPETLRLLSKAAAQEPLPFILRRFLGDNLDEIAPADAQPGDVLLFRWRALETDAEPPLPKQFHHVAFFVDVQPAPAGSIVHAVDTAPGRGGVDETILSPHDRLQITSAWRIPQTAQI